MEQNRESFVKKAPSFIYCTIMFFITCFILLGLWRLKEEFSFYSVYDDISWLNIPELIWFDLNQILIYTGIETVLFQIPLWVFKLIFKNKNIEHKMLINWITIGVGIVFCFIASFFLLIIIVSIVGIGV